MNTQETLETLPASQLVKNQKRVYGWKVYTEGGRTYRIKAEVRHDDECGNGHNTFSITGEIEEKRGNQFREYSGGCLHDEIAKHFPELAPFIKWHLTSTDGPMHYAANVVYLAGERDCHGKRKGEPSSFDLMIKFNGFPLLWRGHRTEAFIKWLGQMEDAAADCTSREIPYPSKGRDRINYPFAPKYTLSGFGDEWHDCPFDTRQEADAFIQSLKVGFEVVRIPTAWSEGKARELNAARSVAVWPEATDEELSVDPEELKAKLLERLPALMAEFKAAVESLGFSY